MHSFPLQYGASENNVVMLVFASAILCLICGYGFLRWVLKQDQGSQGMKDVSAAIQEGAGAYLSRQFKTLAVFLVVIGIGLFLMYRGEYVKKDLGLKVPAGIAIAFLLGCMASASAGYTGMWLAVRANARVAAAALSSFSHSLRIAFWAGAVSGLFTVGLGLLGACIIFMVFGKDAMAVLVGFGFGGSLVALFMRVGGGIFTKAADVGADLVGKVEAGIPEDDPRNPATVADNVGDNVGDCAGMAADVFESYEVTLVAAIILGVFAMNGANASDAAKEFGSKLWVFPLLVRMVGVAASILGILLCRAKETGEVGDAMKPINAGFYSSIGASVVGILIVTGLFMKDASGMVDWRFALATVSGLVLAIVIGELTNWYTHVNKPPVTEIAHSTKTGPATMILSGLAQGMESSVWSVLAIGGSILASFVIFAGDPALGAYGIALAGLGLLTTTGYILAMDTYGPISDNANGVFEMSGTDPAKYPNATKVVAQLDSVGNTTKALTKGFAIATAVLAAISLFKSYIDEAKLFEVGEKVAKGVADPSALSQYGVQVNEPMVFVGFLIGGAVPFLFSAFAINAVSRAAFLIVEEVRRQFREIKGIMDGTGRPEYGKCVAIATASAQKELIGPGILAVATPILVCFGLGFGAFGGPIAGAAALGGYLAGALLTGQLLAVYMSNTGGAWDNAKKKIEDGLFGGKGTEYHKAGVIGDTVGDPLKDTAGPALNPMIKVMNLVSLLIAPIAVGGHVSNGVRAVVCVVCIAALVTAVCMSKRGSIVDLEAEAKIREIELAKKAKAKAAAE